MLDLIDDRKHVLDRYQPFHVAHADMLNRAGHVEQAGSALMKAIELTDNQVERTYLKKRLAAMMPKS